MSTLEVNTITPQSGTTLTLGGSGQTVTLGSGVSGSGFGKIGQVLYTTTSLKTTCTTTAFIDVNNMSLSITPTSTSSKIYGIFLMAGVRRSGANNYGTFWINRQINGGGYSELDRIENGLGYSGVSETVSLQCTGFFLDSPATTSQVDYKITMRNELATGTVTVNNDQQELSSITLMEVLA